MKKQKTIIHEVTPLKNMNGWVKGVADEVLISKYHTGKHAIFRTRSFGKSRYLVFRDMDELKDSFIIHK